MNGNKSDKKFTKYDLEMAQWRGDVTRGIKDLGDDMKEIKKCVKALDKRLTNIQIKMAAIGASVAVIVSLLMFLLRSFF